MFRMAQGSSRNPSSLYDRAISAFVTNLQHYKNDLASLPRNVLFSVCYRMYKKRQLEALESIFSDLKTFVSLLSLKDKEYLLYHVFQALVDRDYGFIEGIASAYKSLATHAMTNTKADKDTAIQIALQLSSFLNDGGWYQQSETILVNCLLLCKSTQSERQVELCLECYQRLLRVRNCFCKFDVAEETYKEALEFLEQIPAGRRQHSNLAGLYDEFTNFFSSQNDYVEASKWSAEALKQIETCNLVNVQIAVLGQASMIHVLKRDYTLAGSFVKRSLDLAKEFYGVKHPIMANCLSDCGFYLLNIDRAADAVKAYKSALKIRRMVFGGNNIRVARAHQHLAFALYVRQYNSGVFLSAREHCDKAMEIMVKLLPENHLFMVSLKGVKAHILEEMAIASQSEIFKKNLLLECQRLYETSLPVMQEKYGEMSLQIAKYYTSIGRLYQSMERYQESEAMHLKAIEIKEKLLKPDDYEIALSLGYLASLYNYNMQKYDEAEALYLCSINITMNVFGISCNGLKIEFEGLINLYNAKGDNEKADRYRAMLSHWKRLRNEDIDQDVIDAFDL